MLLAAVTCVVPAIVAAAPAAAAVAGGGGCTTVSIPVALTQGGPANQTVSAQYCRPAGRAIAIDVLAAGATYSHIYWDFPVEPGTYNFTDKMLAAGQAVLAFDKIGTGSSSRPPSTDVTFSSDVYVLHQLIGWARSSGYAQVNVIGHSMGSFIAVYDAGTWPSDPTRLVLTGFLNTITPGGEEGLSTDLYPANEDPLFARDGLDPGYLTTTPGTREALFYDPANVNPAVVTYDEAHKDTVTASELSSLVPVLGAPAAGNIANSVTAPVLIVDGQEDALLCVGGTVNCDSWPAMYAFEAPYFSSAASLAAISIPNTGHDVALSPTADISAAAIKAWLALTPVKGG
jgi:pimeloyl-ACP methyl ester carboxylesterase